MSQARSKMTIDIEGNISQLQNALNQLRGDFSKTFNGEYIKGISKEFSTIQSKIDDLRAKLKTQDMSSKGINGMLGDTTKISKSIEAITREYQGLIEKAGGSKAVQLIPAETIDNINEAIKKTKELEKAQKAAKKHGEDYKTKEAEYKNALKAQKSNQSTIDQGNKDIANAQKTKKRLQPEIDLLEKRKNAVEQTIKKVKELEAIYEKHGADKTKKLTVDGQTYNLSAAKGDATKAQHEAEKNPFTKDDETLLKAKKKEYKDADDQQASAMAKVNKATTAQADLQAAVERTKTAFEDAQKAEENAVSPELNDKWHKLRDALKEAGADVSKFPADFDASKVSMEELNQITTNLTDQALAKLQESLGQTSNGLHEFDAANQQVTNDLREQKAAAEETEKAHRETGVLTNRIKMFVGLAGGIQLARRAMRQAITTIKELDAQFKEMAVVTSSNIGDYWNQLPTFTEQANKLGVQIKDVAQAQTLYYQQGLKAVQVQQISTSTLRMARIAGLGAEEATNKMTAALRGFNMEINQTNADRIADVYSKLAAITASNTKEISTAMTKTASLASNAGMQFETTAAFLAQIIETTRESAETAGTALKTVIARFQELKKSPEEIGEVDGEIVDANKIEGALRTVGVALRDTNGQFRDLDQVFLELAQKWDTLDINTQRYIATIAAGSRQQSRFIAMMSDYQRTQQLVAAANNAAGASVDQFNKTLESLEAKLNQLQNSWNSFTLALMDSSLIKTGVDLLRMLLDAINKVSDALNFIPFGGVAARIGILIAALKAGDVALNAFLAKWTKTHSVVSSAGAAFGAVGTKIRTFATNIIYGGAAARQFKSNIITLTATQGAYQKMLNKVTKASTEEYSIWWSQMALSKAREKGIITETIETEALKEAKKADSNATRAQIVQQALYAGTLKLTDEEQEAMIGLTGLGITVDKAAALAKQGLTAEAFLSVTGNDKEAASKLANAMATNMLSKNIFRNIFATAQRTALVYADKHADEQGALAKIKLAIAQKVATMACWQFYLVILIVIAVIVALVFAIKGLIAIYQDFYNHTTEGKMKKAKEALQALEEKASSAKESYDKLKESINKINDQEVVLSTLTKGTEAWNDAVVELNQSILETITQFPELAKALDTTESGVLKLDNQLAGDVVKAERNRLMQIQTAVLIQQGQVRRLQEQSKFEALSDSAMGLTYDKAVNAGRHREGSQAWDWFNLLTSGGPIGTGGKFFGDFPAQGGVASDLELLELIPGIGGLIGLINEWTGYNAQESANYLTKTRKNSTDTMARAIASGDIGGKLLKAFDTMEEGSSEFNDSIKETIDSIDGLSSSLKEDWYKALSEGGKNAIDELRKYGEQLVANDAAERAQAKAIATQRVNELEGAYGLNHIQKNALINLGTNEAIKDEEFAQRVQNALLAKNADTEFRNEGEGFGSWDTGFYATMFNKYLKPYFESQGYVNVHKGDYGEIKANVNGKTEEIASTQQVATLIASAYRADEANKHSEETIANLSKIKDEKTRNAAYALLSDTANFSNVSEEQINLIRNAGTQVWGILAEELENAGAGSLHGAVEKATEMLNSSIFKGTEKWTARQEKAMDTMARHFDEEDSNKIRDQIDSITSTLTEEQAYNFRDAIASLDFSSVESIQSLTTTLQEMGLSIPTEKIEKLQNDLIKLGNATTNVSFDKMTETLKSIRTDLAAMQTGDDFDVKISEETYKALIAKNPIMARSFTQDLEGNYIYLKGQDELQKAMKELTKATLEDAEVKLQAEIDAADNIKKVFEANNGLLFENKNQWSDDSETWWKAVQDSIKALGEAEAKKLDIPNLDKYYSNPDSLDSNERKAILERLYEIGTSKGTNEIKREANVAQQESLNYQTDFIGKAASDAIKGEKGASDALVSMATNAGGNAAQLQNLAKAAEKASKGFTNAKIQQDKLLASIATSTSYAKGKEKLGTIMEASKELGENYSKTKSEVEKAQLGIQAANQFGIASSEENAQHYAALAYEISQGSQTAYESILQEKIGLEGLTGTFDDLEQVDLKSTTDEQIKELADELEKLGLAYRYVDSQGRQFLRKYDVRSLAKEKGTKNEIEKWYNPYNWLYNTNNDINKLIYARERLEHKWTRAVDQGNHSLELRSGIYKTQLDQLKTEVALRENIIKGSRTEIKNLLKNAPANFGKYVEWDEESGLISANKEQLYRTGWTSEQGSVFETFMGKVEEMANNVDEQVKELESIYDQIEEMQTQMRESYDSLLDLTHESIVQQRQNELDRMNDINETINSTNERLSSYLSDIVSEERKIRQNQETLDNLNDTQAQIDYLMMDTSGGNATEVAKLQKQLTKDQQSFTDTLVDQSIEAMNKANEQASKQRETQIAIAQAQFDWWQEHDAWQQAEQMLNADLLSGTPFSDTLTGKLIQEIKEVDGIATMAAEDFITDLNVKAEVAEEIAKHLTGDGKSLYTELQSYQGEIGDKLDKLTEWTTEIQTLIGTHDTELKDKVSMSDLKTTIESLGTAWTNALNNLASILNKELKEDLFGRKYSIGDTYEGNNGIKYNYAGNHQWTYSITKPSGNKVNQTISTEKLAQLNTPSASNTTKQTSNKKEDQGNETIPNIDLEAAKGFLKKNKITEQIYVGSNLSKVDFENSGNIGSYTVEKFSMPGSEELTYTNKKGRKVTEKLPLYKVLGEGFETYGWVNQNTLDTFKEKGYLNPPTVITDEVLIDAIAQADLSKFKTGGLADFTGPAWLDGTKNRPELVLNQNDTQNFIQLRDVLRSLDLEEAPTNASGDIYYTFDIQVDQLANDYDVEQLADKLRDMVTESAGYRNVNAVNLLR